jgi:hypothetical protein
VLRTLPATTSTLESFLTTTCAGGPLRWFDSWNTHECHLLLPGGGLGFLGRHFATLLGDAVTRLVHAMLPERQLALEPIQAAPRQPNVRLSLGGKAGPGQIPFPNSACEAISFQAGANVPFSARWEIEKVFINVERGFVRGVSVFPVLSSRGGLGRLTRYFPAGRSHVSILLTQSPKLSPTRGSTKVVKR